MQEVGERGSDERATYYELLEIAADAPVDEIKRAFRREIAKYHPDKVQHLGREFQEIAASKAAELTLAYKTLTDSAQRAEYDAQLANGGGHGGAPPRPSSPPPPSRPHASPPPPPLEHAGPEFAADRAGVSEFLKRAAVARFRSALHGEFGSYEEIALQGFEVVCLPAPKFWARRAPPRVLGRVVPSVDRTALSETWGLAVRMKKEPERDLCVFLMGPRVAAPGELAAAIAEQRKKPMPAGGRLVLVPVSTSDWSAHVPTDAPPVVKSLLERLRTR